MPRKIYCLTLAVLLSALLYCKIAEAKTCRLYFPDTTVEAGKILEVPVIIDKAERLAGIRLVVSYAADSLKYNEAAKSPKTAAFLHVVNDNKPGRLIIVMAGAKGITGENIPLINLSFTVNAKLSSTDPVWLQMNKVELMSDQLKEIQCSIESRRHHLKLVGNKAY